jgi:hypothetical protein
MEALLLAVVFVLGVGFLPARAMTASWGLALPLAGPLSGLVCAGAAMIELLLEAPLLPCFFGVTAVTWAASLHVLWRRRRGSLANADLGAAIGSGPAPADVALCGVVAGLSSPVLWGTFIAPVTWDSRYIWWFHATWFSEGGRAARGAMANVFFAYSHSNYPPLASASVASLWSFAQRGDQQAAQALNAVQTWFTLTLLALLVARVVRGGVRRTVAGVTGAALVVAAFGLGAGLGLRGYVDVLCAAAAATAAVAGLVLPPTAQSGRVAAVGLAAAGLTKLEGLAIAVGVLLPLIAARWWLGRRRHGLRPLTVVTLGALTGLAWVALARHITPIGDSAISGDSLTALLGGERQQIDRLSPTLSALWRQLGLFDLVVVVVIVAGTVLLGRRRRALGLSSGLWLPSAAVGVLVVTTFIYVVGAPEIGWWLDTSAFRTTAIVHLLLLTEALLWATVALSCLPRPEEVHRIQPRRTRPER